ncbi:hypothetical protein BDR26DRAFT_852393 [Obelidium mucronatum]|nr:hypothetical protein BDR26DRAFT_852393 [Obelidium mucronatum]
MSFPRVVVAVTGARLASAAYHVFASKKTWYLDLSGNRVRNLQGMLQRHNLYDQGQGQEEEDSSSDSETGFEEMDTEPRQPIDQYEGFALYKEAMTHTVKVNQSNSNKHQSETTEIISDDFGLAAIARRIHSINLHRTPLSASHLQQSHNQLAQSPFYQKIIKEEQERAAKTEKLRLEEIAKASKKDSFPKLSPNAEEIVDNAFGRGPDPVVKGFNVDMTRADIRTLLPGTWLNDEIINFYGQMLMERSQRNPRGEYPKIHFFNTFFYSTLQKSGYNSIKRWSKKFDIFALDMVIIPVHLGMHWCCSVINFRDKRIEYYDSLHGNNEELFRHYRDYLEKESLDKKKVPFNLEGWTNYCPKEVPGQLNGFDCGVFTCMYAEYRSRNAEFDFSQKQMPYIRRRMVYEILEKRLQFD